MGKIDISLLVAFSFTPTAQLKPCSLIRPFFLPVFFFFLPLALSLCLFFFTFFSYDFREHFFPLFFPYPSGFSVSLRRSPLLCEHALYKQYSLPYVVPKYDTHLLQLEPVLRCEWTAFCPLPSPFSLPLYATSKCIIRQLCCCETGGTVAGQTNQEEKASFKLTRTHPPAPLYTHAYLCIYIYITRYIHIILLSDCLQATVRFGVNILQPNCKTSSNLYLNKLLAFLALLYCL